MKDAKDAILTSWCRSNNSAITAANKPDIIVAFSGVFVRTFTRLNTLYSNPSEDIAYKTRGSGNIAPNKLVNNANTAPIDTILYEYDKWKEIWFNSNYQLPYLAQNCNRFSSWIQAQLPDLWCIFSWTHQRWLSSVADIQQSFISIIFEC